MNKHIKSDIIEKSDTIIKSDIKQQDNEPIEQNMGEHKTKTTNKEDKQRTSMRYKKCQEKIIKREMLANMTEDKILRTGDIAKIKFEFLIKPEYIMEKMKLIFREGKVKAVGKVIKNQNI